MSLSLGPFHRQSDTRRGSKLLSHQQVFRRVLLIVFLVGLSHGSPSTEMCDPCRIPSLSSSSSSFCLPNFWFCFLSQGFKRPSLIQPGAPGLPHSPAECWDCRHHCHFTTLWHFFK